VRAFALPKRLGYPEEFASLCVELLANSYMNAESVRIDCGHSHAAQIGSAREVVPVTNASIPAGARPSSPKRTNATFRAAFSSSP